MVNQDIRELGETTACNSMIQKGWHIKFTHNQYLLFTPSLKKGHSNDFP